MARGVVKSLPATLAISRVPVTAALRNDGNVNGPCGKNTAAASTRVMTSSSPHWAGSGRAFARASLSALRLGMLNAVLMSSRDRASASSTCTRNLLFGKLDALAVRQSAASECKSDDCGLLVSGSEVRALARRPSFSGFHERNRLRRPNRNVLSSSAPLLFFTNILVISGRLRNRHLEVRSPHLSPLKAETGVRFP